MSTSHSNRNNLTTKNSKKNTITEREKQEIGKLLNEKFTCSICFDIFEDPSGLKCGHIYCSKCLILWLRDHQTCPLCRSSVSYYTSVTKYGFLAKLITDMKSVLAPNVERRHTVNILNYVEPMVYNSGRRNNRQNINERPPWR